MKKLFTILAVAAAVVACQKNETIALDNGEAIAFGNAFVENSVRADYSSTDLKGFTLYGTVNNVNIYNEVAVTKGTANYGDAWTCPVQQYWIEGAAYKFAAVVDADEVIVDETTKMPKSLVYAAAGQKDMLYKYVEKTGQAKGDNDIVGFTFTHLLAKAYFTLTNNTNDTKYTYSISNVQVTNAYQNGVYAVTGDNGSWTGSDPDDTNFDSIENVAYGKPQTNAAVLLIPGASVGVSFKVTLKIDNKEVTSYDVTKDTVVTPTANSVYNFNVAISPNDPIQFTVTAKPNWGDTTTVSAN